MQGFGADSMLGEAGILGVMVTKGWWFEILCLAFLVSAPFHSASFCFCLGEAGQFWSCRRAMIVGDVVSCLLCFW